MQNLTFNLSAWFVGIKIGLAFLIGFVLTGFPVNLSLILAGVGTLAGVWIAQAWNSIKTSPTETISAQVKGTQTETWRRSERRSRTQPNVFRAIKQRLFESDSAAQPPEPPEDSENRRS